MPRRAIATENRVGDGGNRFPKLDFKEKGERKRVLLIDPDGPWQEYVHYLRAPKFKDGMPVMTTRERRGEEVPDYDTDFIGMPLCYGDAETVAEQGYDAANCPACAKVAQAPAEARLAPQLRFAANVVDQVLRGGTWDIRKPYSASVVIWTFTSSMYDEIISLQEQNGALIRERDITLECSNAKFNQVKMGVMNTPGWQEANAGAILKELLETPGNVATDDQLKDACGRQAKRAFMEEDVALCLKRWEKALRLNGVELGDSTAGTSFGGGPSSLGEGIKALVGEPDGEAANDMVTGNGTVDPFAAGSVTTSTTAAAVEQVAAARAEVQRDLSGMDMFAQGGQDRAQEAVNAAAAERQGADVDPFGNAGGSPQSQPEASPSAASPESSPAASTAPAGTQTAPPPSEGAAAGGPKKSRFDTLLAGLGGQG